MQDLRATKEVVIQGAAADDATDLVKVCKHVWAVNDFDFSDLSVLQKELSIGKL